MDNNNTSKKRLTEGQVNFVEAVANGMLERLSEQVEPEVYTKIVGLLVVERFLTSAGDGVEYAPEELREHMKQVMEYGNMVMGE